MAIREIEFRAKSIDNQWVYGDLYHNQIETMIIEQPSVNETDVDKNTLGQFTGLCDKNGKKIFEGDILEFDFHEICKQRAIVYYNEKYCAFLLNVITADFQYASICDGIVIGNIYDNPELLGGENESNND